MRHVSAGEVPCSSFDDGTDISSLLSEELTLLADGTQTFKLNFDSPKEAGCHALSIELADDSSITAYFSLR